MFAAQLIRGTGGVLAALVCTTACVGARASVRPVHTGVTVPSSAMLTPSMAVTTSYGRTASRSASDEMGDTSVTSTPVALGGSW